MEDQEGGQTVFCEQLLQSQLRLAQHCATRSLQKKNDSRDQFDAKLHREVKIEDLKMV
jgi:hypothetical protein